MIYFGSLLYSAARIKSSSYVHAEVSLDFSSSPSTANLVTQQCFNSKCTVMKGSRSRPFSFGMLPMQISFGFAMTTVSPTAASSAFMQLRPSARGGYRVHSLPPPHSAFAESSPSFALPLVALGWAASPVYNSALILGAGGRMKPSAGNLASSTLMMEKTNVSSAGKAALPGGSVGQQAPVRQPRRARGAKGVSQPVGPLQVPSHVSSSSDRP